MQRIWLAHKVITDLGKTNQLVSMRIVDIATVHVVKISLPRHLRMGCFVSAKIFK